MEKFTTLIAVAGLSAMCVFGFSTGALANCSSGFIADALCQAGVIDQQTANTADAWNAATGQPVDNAIYDGMDDFVPGSGDAARLYAQRDRFLPSAPPVQYRQPTPFGPQPYPQPVPFQQPAPFPQMRIASVCVTPFSVAPMMMPVAVGSSCFVATPMGPVGGVAQ